MSARTVTSLLFALAVVAVSGVGRLPAAPDEKGQPTPRKGITFKVIAGSDNGSKAILDKRQAEVTEKKGGKLGGHDWWLWGLTAIDYDRDGDPDLIMTVHGPGGHGVLLKNQFKETGKPTLVNVTQELGVDWQLPTGEGRKTFVWDFDGDGWLDFSGLHTPHFFNQAGKKFVPSSKKGFGVFKPEAIVDLNGDGYPDVYNADGTGLGGGNHGIWNPKTKAFDLQPFTHPLKDKAPENVQKLWKDAKADNRNRFLRVNFFTEHDLDGDGEPEAVVAGHASYGGVAFGRYLRKAKQGSYSDATREMGLPEAGTPILVRDLNGDGYLDLLIAASSEAGLWLNDGKGKFTLRPGPLTDLLREPEPYLQRAEVADFDNDGRLDLVVSKPRTGPTAIFANLGEGKFEPLHKIRGWDSDPVAICDLNDDGLMDVAIGGPGNQITFFLNTTPNPGNACRIYPRLAAPNPYAVGTKFEVFRAGTLDKPGARPILREMAHPDATPVHIGLGTEKAFDLRVTFPGKAPVELKNVQARERLEIGADGKIGPHPPSK